MSKLTLMQESIMDKCHSIIDDMLWCIEDDNKIKFAYLAGMLTSEIEHLTMSGLNVDMDEMAYKDIDKCNVCYMHNEYWTKKTDADWDKYWDKVIYANNCECANY